MRDHLAPPPDAINLPEGEALRLSADDGFALRAAFFRPPADARANPRGTIFLLQGRAEFIEKYAEVIAELLARGFAVATLDWRGQGGSARMMKNSAKGHVEDFTDYERDLAALMAAARAHALPEPYGLLAHSTGAAIALHHLARDPSAFGRAILCAPLVEIGGLRWKAGARALSRLFSLLGLAGLFVPTGKAEPTNLKPFEGNPLTGDETRYRRPRAWHEAAPDLFIGDPTIGWVEAAFESLARFRKPDFGQKNRTPILMVLGGADHVTDPRAAGDLAVRMRGASSITLAEARHEILFERDPIRAAFWAAFDAFMLPEETALP
ncbi:MAG: alpha/beta hydrolase [Proteobacteria bacterium]|nr:alpha/beta hydrolase [Pseudomonadota bacterium]